MSIRQKSRSEETKQAILTAAGELFAARGYDAVTMREIAKAAGCSHTTIYIYFKDKEALLHQLSMGPLETLKQSLESTLNNTSQSAEERLKSFAREFIEFCLTNRNVFSIFFMARGSRVDEEQPALEIQSIRNQMFGLLRQAIQACLDAKYSDELVLAYARIFFYTIHGILATYKGSEEELTALMERLTPTFELAVDVMIAGFKQTLKEGVTLE